jgi:hypothetical protein
MRGIMKRTKHLPPEQNYTHLSPYCRKPECVFGFIDWFDLDDNYLTTTVCAVCKPETFDLLQMFPNVGQRTEAQQRLLAEKRENLKVGKRDGF